MANQQHIEWLFEGVESWNKRRETNDFQPDLGGANLSGFHGWEINLSNADLTYTNLTDASLPYANLTNARLSNANLTKAQLTHANLTDAWFIQANLIEAELGDTSLTNAKLQLANLTDANLTNADLTDAHLSGANLTRTCFAYAPLWQAYLFGGLYEYWGSRPPTVTIDQLDIGEKSVTTISDLLEIVKTIKQEHQNDEISLYFRGEARNDWKLSPSILRDDARPAASREGEMLRNLITRRPDEFSIRTSAFSQWALGQHHGLKTRFLDIMRNPLAALFFACEGYHDQPGRLHVFAVPQSMVKPYDNDTVRVIANFAKLSEIDRLALSGRLRRLPRLDPNTTLHDFNILGPSAPSRYAATLHRLYQLIREEKPNFEDDIDIRDFYRIFVVEPQQSSERIRAQTGAFLVSAFHKRFERDKVLAKTKDVPIYAHYKLTVPSRGKASLRDDLAFLNITRETLFPGLDESAKAVIDEALHGSD